MTSPFKTHETMDLARALLEEDSNSITNCSTNTRNRNHNDESDIPRRSPLDLSKFDNLVISKDSSTELISTRLVEESCAADFSYNGKLTASNSNNNNTSPVLIRDMNAGKGMLDDDGKPAVGKVFSRVINVSGVDNKPKQLKSHHRGRSSSSCCRDSRHGGGCGTQCQGHHDKERSSSARPQSGQQLLGRPMGGDRQHCPRCNRQFSDESMMKNHIVFCSGSSKDIM